MGRRSKVDTLPPEVKAWLERALVEANFAEYEQLEALLTDKGFSIGKSSINRYGQKLQQRLAAIKASTEAARLISEHTADEKDARSEAIIALVQTELFDTIVNLQEAANEEDQAERVTLLSKAAKNIATLTRASVNLKQHQANVREEERRKLLEEQKAKLDELGSSGVVTKETQLLIRRTLGIG